MEEFTFIDTHVHCGMWTEFYMTQEMVEEMIKKYPVRCIFISNTDACENDDRLNPLPFNENNTQNRVFKRTIEFARKHPGKIYVMPWIKPSLDGVDEEFENLIKENTDVVKGIKFHAHNSKLRTDSPLLEPYISLAEKYDLPVAVHTGGVEEASAKYVYNAALKHRKVKFIMVHMELGTDNENAIEYISKLDNLYGDTTWVPIKSVSKFIEKCGSDRLVFGSDSPIDGLDTYMFNKTGQPSLYRQYFNDLKDLVPKQVYEKIMYKNAMKLFKIN